MSSASIGRILLVLGGLGGAYAVFHALLEGNTGTMWLAILVVAVTVAGLVVSFRTNRPSSRNRS